ncbi:MAG: FkbM family methyltransferase [Vicinamibacterales bacterium]
MSTPASHPPLWVRAARPVVRRLPAGRYLAIRWLCRGRRDRFIAPFTAGRCALSFVCDLRDGIAREACFIGGYGPQETRLLDALLAPGMTVIDVGANWGYFTLVAASIVGPRGRVIALEPEPRLFDLLEQNLRLNGLSHATALREAATDRASTMALHTFDENCANWGVSSVVRAQPGAVATTVAGRPLDAVVRDAGLASIHLVKIDVEGHELEVLAGMACGLRAGRYRRLIVEWHPAALRSPRAALEAGFAGLSEAGYRGWWIDHTQAATRSAAYGGPLRLYPVHAAGFDDAWPHTIWVAPGEADPAS